MATMLDDYQHMDIRDADVKNGLVLLFGEKIKREVSVYSAGDLVDSFVTEEVETPLALLCKGFFLFSRGYMSGAMKNLQEGMVGVWQIRRKVKDYNRRWLRVPRKEKRDVIAALRTATKTAKYAALATKILVWLA